MQATHAQRLYVGTSAERQALFLPPDAFGAQFVETDTGKELYWNGSAWTQAGSAVSLSDTVSTLVSGNPAVPGSSTNASRGDHQHGLPSTSAPKNMLINGGFDFFQRLVTPTTLTTISDVKYGPDRWKMTRSAADLQTSQLDGTGVSGIESKNYAQFKQITNASKHAVFQFLEAADSIPVLNTTVIFQCKMKASSAKTIKLALVELQNAGTADTLPAALVSAWNADTVNPTLGTNLAYIGTPASALVTTSFQQFSFSATLPTNSKNVGVVIFTDSAFAANDILYVAEAGLYVSGSVQSWLPLPFVHERHRCLRYMYSAPDQFSGATFAQIGAVGVGASAILAYVSLVLPVQLRIKPTLLTTGNFILSDNVNNTVITSIVLNAASLQTIQILFECSTAGGLTQFRAYFLYTNNDTTARVFLDADL